MAAFVTPQCVCLESGTWVFSIDRFHCGYVGKGYRIVVPVENLFSRNRKGLKVGVSVNCEQLQVYCEATLSLVKEFEPDMLEVFRTEFEEGMKAMGVFCTFE